MKIYIGVKKVSAEPEVREGTDGYKVVYEDGYVSWSPKKVFEESYRTVKTPEDLTDVLCAPHIERVKAEASELNEKILKLDTFIESNPQFCKLSEGEQDLLYSQVLAMSYYYSVLVERINLASSNG